MVYENLSYYHEDLWSVIIEQEWRKNFSFFTIKILWVYMENLTHSLFHLDMTMSEGLKNSTDHNHHLDKQQKLDCNK